MWPRKNRAQRRRLVSKMLYADTVEVLSLGNQMIRDVNKFAAGDATDLYALLTSLPDSILLPLAPNIRDVDQWRQLVPLLMTLDPNALRSVADANPQRENCPGACRSPPPEPRHPPLHHGRDAGSCGADALNRASPRLCQPQKTAGQAPRQDPHQRGYRWSNRGSLISSTPGEVVVSKCAANVACGCGS